MATWNIATFTKYAGAGRNDMAVALSYPSAGSSGAENGWTNLGQQDPANVTTRRALQYCTLALGVIDDTQLAAIQVDAHYLLLVRWEANVVTPSFDNRQSVITSPQRDTFVTFFLGEYVIDVSKIPVIQNSPGRTRQAVLIDVVQDIRAL